MDFIQVPRTILIVRHDLLQQFAAKGEEGDHAPPCFGASHEKDLEEMRAHLDPLLEVDRLGSYLFWRQMVPRDIAPP